MSTTTNVKAQIKQLEIKLAESEKARSESEELLTKYRAAASGANDGLWDYDFIKDEAFVSLPWKTMLGFDPDENVPGDIWEHLLHPEDKDVAIKNYKEFISGKQHNYDQIFRLKHTDGTYRWIHSKARAIRDDDGNALRISGSHTDITRNKKAEVSLQKSEEKYKKLFENSQVAMFRMNLQNGNIKEANKKLSEILEIKDRNNCDFTYYLNNISEQEFKKNISKGNVENLELELKSEKGNTVWTIFSSILYKEEGEVDCVLKDITQTKENLIELQKVNFELDSFVYHASHDLRSPLRSVIGLIDLYRIEHQPAIREECIEKIESSVKRLDTLVMDLLSISRNDRVDGPDKEINFMNEINQSVSSYYNASNTKGLEILLKVSQPVAFVSDLTRVRIILNNLISNAIKYRSYHKERSLVMIEAVVNTERAKILIKDNGEGIVEDKLPHIFDMFFRATEKSEGSGLGLYIVKKVADKLGAKIQVESVELEGTTFTVEIPNSLLT